MLIKELKSKKDDELLKLIDDLKAELFMLRFKNSTGQLKEFHKINVVKKEIARILTILNSRKQITKNLTKEAKASNNKGGK